MFALQAETPPEWRDVAADIRLQLKPAGTEALNAGRRAVRDALRLDEGADAEFAFVHGAVAWGAMAWEGVGDPQGEPLPITAEALGRLLRQRPDVYAVLDTGYVHQALELLNEGNGSRPSPNGTSAAGHPTAKRARSGTRTRKAAASAPTGSTSPIPTPETASGEPSELASPN